MSNKDSDKNSINFILVSMSEGVIRKQNYITLLYWYQRSTHTRRNDLSHYSTFRLANNFGDLVGAEMSSFREDPEEYNDT